MFSPLTDGVYEIQLSETSEKYNAYCHMSELDQCTGGGWTLIMKIDGNKASGLVCSSYKALCEVAVVSISDYATLAILVAVCF